MLKFQFVILALALSVSWSCAKQAATAAAGGPHATIALRSGQMMSGSVVASSPTQVTLVTDDTHATTTLDMKDVRSIDYGDTAVNTTPAAAAVPGAPAPVTPAPEASVPSPPVDDTQLHEQHYHPEESAIRTRTYVVPAGTQLAVRTEETIDSSRAVEGQTFAAEITRDVVDADGACVIPRGSNATIVIRSASKGGRFRGTSDLIMDLGSVSVGGQQYRLETSDVVRNGKSGVGENKRTAEYTGGGAVVGAIIGAIAGHGKGAAIGAASGAGAGAATQVLTKGAAIRVPVESVMTFRLEQPLRVSRAG